MQTFKSVARENAYLLLTFSAIITLCCFLAAYAQPFADDYCHAFDIRQSDSFWAYLQHNWQYLNGRWATTSLRYLADSILNPDAIYWLTVPISISCVFLGFYFFISTLTFSVANKIVFASLFSLIFIAIASKVGELLFWGTGLSDYTFGYMLTGLSCFLLVSLAKCSKLNWKNSFLYLSTLTLLLNAGMSELFIVPLGLLLVFLLLFHSQRLFFLIPSSAFALGTMLNVFAPGNSARLSRVEHTLDLQLLKSDSLIYGLRGLLLPSIALFLLSHVFFIKKPLLKLIENIETQVSKQTAQLLTAFAIAFPFIVILALVFSLGSPGPGRAHNVSLFFVILLWPIICSQLTFLQPKTFTKKWANYPLAILGFVLLFSVNVKKMAEDATGSIQAYDVSLDAARATMSSSDNANKNVVLSSAVKRPNIASGGGFIVTTDVNSWVNKCVAMYHSNKSTLWVK